MLTKTNKYILYAIICFSLIISIRTFIHKHDGIETKDTKSIDIEQKIESLQKQPMQALNNPAVMRLSLLMGVYGFLLFLGIISACSFALKKSANKPLIESSQNPIPLSCPDQEKAKLFFAIGLLILLLQLSLTITATETRPQIKTCQALLINMFMEIGIIAIIIKNIPFNDLGIKKDAKLLDSLKVYTATLPIILFASMILEKLGIIKKPTEVIELFFAINNQLSLNILIFQVILFGPIAEELLFRGFIYKTLRQKSSFLTASTITSIIFACLHLEPGYTIPLFIISLGLCYIYERTQNILSPIFIHIIFNTVNIALALGVKDILAA